MTHAQWWRDAVVYQVYPRSFADGDGDGIGDLTGLHSRLGYLADLGVDAIWLNPFYPSPLADGGYDVSDFCAVDPRLGTLEQFTAMIAAAHDLGLRVVIDIIPNHTSDQHPWFRAALDSPPGSAERRRYLFLDGHGDEPPSDWMSQFGGSAWERVPDGQWYCHLFGREQPDLNWSDERVRASYREILRFWADRGVDGFRVDAAHCVVKDLREPLRSRPGIGQDLPADGSDPIYDRDGVHEIYREWRSILDEYDPPRMAIAETWYPTNKRTHLYARPDELGQVFDFSLLKAEWDRDEMHAVIRRSLAAHAGAGSTPTWVLSSHDVMRAASRYALPRGADPDAWLHSGGTDPVVDPELGRTRARAAVLMMLALPGCAYLYQGEELGLLEVADLAEADLRDPIWTRSHHHLKGRDGCRVPLAWTRTGRSLGFSDADAWLPQPRWFAESSVEAMTGDPDGVLEMYRAALLLRRERDMSDHSVYWRETDPDSLRFVRANGWECVINFSDHSIPMPSGEVLIVSSRDPVRGVLPPQCAAWLVAG